MGSFLKEFWQPIMKGVFMEKAKSVSDDLRPEYKRCDFGKLERVKASSNVVS